MVRKIIALIFVLALVAVGCPQQAEPEPEAVTENVTLYYGSEGNEELVTEEREISYREGEDRYQVVLEELIAGPETEGYTANIPEETEVYGTILQNDSLLVNFSEEFTNFGGSVAEVVAIASVVNTLTQFEEIERVKILAEGEELIAPSGERRGFMEPFATEITPPAVQQTVILYFARPDATAVVPEEREISLPQEAEFAQQLELVLEELIAGPQREDLSPTIPAEVSVLNVDVAENTATVNFSEEMHTEHTGGAAGETMTILSIVNTLTEFPEVEDVLMQVEGEPMNIEHVILDAPVQRNEELIEEE
ncbi:GerMN domain-containing protein [Dethiobacter alkaliphilus]|uniref:Spore germination protein-like protein n=1 Tax=Dethiobacter alkaliphilus AHT 1 TaxID=555088 RepID=C0GCP9_DETAL|nr:GerMN domain-containing protein [Dethiobacter alkaliphilus]EEG78984.1 Spore germination protein-like protein [Dethiobacter alkaliphilus AHT 1]